MKIMQFIVPLACVAMLSLPIQSEASPRHHHKGKHHTCRGGMNRADAARVHFQQSRINDLRSMALADGRISRNERVILKYEERKLVTGKHHHKRGSKRNR